MQTCFINLHSLTPMLRLSIYWAFDIHLPNCTLLPITVDLCHTQGCHYWRGSRQASGNNTVHNFAMVY